MNMAIELFGKTRDEATADGFALTDADFAAYNPGDFFTQTEMVDTVPRLDRVFTEDRLEVAGRRDCGHRAAGAAAVADESHVVLRRHSQRRDDRRRGDKRRQ